MNAHNQQRISGNIDDGDDVMGFERSEWIDRSKL
jgi:hypothetical protein